MTIYFYRVNEPYGRLSNFAPYPIEVDGVVWPTSEHYFQAKKFAGTPDEEELRRASTPSLVADLGRDRKRALRPDWETVKDDVMRIAVRAKITQHDALRRALLATGQETLVEKTNSDYYWGCGSDGSGKNMLGQILMELRAELTGLTPQMTLGDWRTAIQRVDIWQGNIVELRHAAIVNAAKSSLLGGGGVDGAIHHAAGPTLVEECRTLGGCEPGNAKITDGYLLPARHVIHTVGPVWQGGKADEAAILERCYRRSLALCQARHLASVAFSGISTGVYGYPLDLAADIAVRTVVMFLISSAYPQTVTFCTFDDRATSVMQRALAQLETTLAGG